MSTGSVAYLSRDERRERAEGATVRKAQMRNSDKPKRCLYCTAKLSNGAPVCDETCDNGWWEVVPTISGELWT